MKRTAIEDTIHSDEHRLFFNKRQKVYLCHDVCHIIYFDVLIKTGVNLSQTTKSRGQLESNHKSCINCNELTLYTKPLLGQVRCEVKWNKVGSGMTKTLLGRRRLCIRKSTFCFQILPFWAQIFKILYLTNSRT